MPSRIARQALSCVSPSRAAPCVGLAVLGLMISCNSLQTVVANGDTRAISLQHTHRDDTITVTFKRNGRYDEDGLKKLSYFLRDWRNDEQTRMDPQLFDILWEVSREVDTKEAIHIVSSYRSPQTNSMLRRRSRGVAQFSQHMLGKAIDFHIPGVAVEQLRAAGMRLQRGGVGFYPGSFVHVDVGSVRHWPRMTYDQLARVFPDGRTVHLPSNGGPLKGYELARAEIEKRGNGDDAATVGKKPSLFAALFRGGKSSDEDDEGSAPIRSEKPASPVVMAAAPVKSTETRDAVPTPRAKPLAAATLQLASADAQIVPAPKARPAPAAQASTDKLSADKAEPKPQTPADIINARGFWDDAPATANQATPLQVAALKARQAVGAADPQPTASVSEAFNKALAYAPAASAPVDRANVVAASAPVPRAVRPTRNAAVPATEINTVVTKGPQGQNSVISTSTRLAAARGNDVWMRVVMLAPSASDAMSTTVLGDTDMTLMRGYFIKPQTAIAMTFSEDPMMGMTTDRFSGSATARLATQSFVQRTASLR